MESLFAPFHPDEWKQNPSAWLSNHDIFNVLAQYEKAYPEFHFIGPTPIDFDSAPKHMMMYVYGKIYVNFRCKKR